MSCNGCYILDHEDDKVIRFVNDSCISHGSITLCLLPSDITKRMIELCKTIGKKEKNLLRSFKFPNNPECEPIMVRPGKRRRSSFPLFRILILQQVVTPITSRPITLTRTKFSGTKNNNDDVATLLMMKLKAHFLYW